MFFKPLYVVCYLFKVSVIVLPFGNDLVRIGRIYLPSYKINTVKQLVVCFSEPSVCSFNFVQFRFG